MPTKKKSAPAKASNTDSRLAREDQAEAVIATLKRIATKRERDGLARYGIPSELAFGVSVGALQKYAKRLGTDHELAGALWDTGWYEARMLATFVDDPALVTPAQMERWCRDFDSWATCDTACFHLFDRTPDAWRKFPAWARRQDEFVKRAGFALLACLAGHDKHAGDDRFARCLPLVERGAKDERNFVKKGVSWDLRGIGRRSRGLHAAAVALARCLSDSSDAAARWVGKNALRDLMRPVVTKRFAARGRAADQ